MNILGIDLATVPWPMFLLLVFMVVAFFWYMNVYLPLLEQLEKNKDQNANTLDTMTKQMGDLSESVNEIQKNVFDTKNEEGRINTILKDIEVYADSLHDISKSLTEKEHADEHVITDIKNNLSELSHTVNDIKERLYKKKFF